MKRQRARRLGRDKMLWYRPAPGHPLPTTRAGAPSLTRKDTRTFDRPGTRQPYRGRE